MPSYRGNIWRLFVAQALFMFLLWVPIWVIFLQQKGLRLHATRRSAVRKQRLRNFPLSIRERIIEDSGGRRGAGTESVTPNSHSRKGWSL